MAKRKKPILNDNDPDSPTMEECEMQECAEDSTLLDAKEESFDYVLSDEPPETPQGQIINESKAVFFDETTSSLKEPPVCIHFGLTKFPGTSEEQKFAIKARLKNGELILLKDWDEGPLLLELPNGEKKTINRHQFYFDALLSQTLIEFGRSFANCKINH